MRNILKKIQSFILKCIDFFYPPFRGKIPIDVFRYGACGGANTVFDWLLYFVVYHFVVRKQIVDLGVVALSPHIASLFITFPITFFSGFLLSKYISFRGSVLRGRTQLTRYAMVVAACILINYASMKFFVDLLHFYPTPSKMLTTFITIIFSFFSQRNFTFKK
ncbi:MAG: GtrA family protein [Paludibacteraceae bacterium]|nr:GtrA family protein [Paludibacteraceae bacterium]MBR6310995.1 GtrA family protein [Paludibacteraceae bacterium]MDD6357960.1 GtrA family protein [Bacteroidales bacterium]